MGRGHELGDEVRRPARRLEHPPPLGRVHPHPRLAEHVLAVLERGQRDLAVHVRPRPDADRVDVAGPHDVPPVLVDAGDAELARDALARLLRPVGHGDELDPRQGPEPRDVPDTGVVAGAHESHADRLVGHGATL